MRARTCFASLSTLVLVSLPRLAHADNVLHVGQASLDPPTVVSLGVQVLVTGDDNRDGKITLKYRKQGDATFRDGLTLLHVDPSVVSGFTVPNQFAGSIFDLKPDTTYEIELHATDADGNVDQTIMLMGKTRPVPPLNPKMATAATATDTASLQAALAAAVPGSVIRVLDGTYNGPFQINADGTEDNPIVIDGQSVGGTILDGGGCPACNVLEVYGSFVHVSHLTIQNANRGLRFQGQGAQGNVVRHVRIKDVTLGIGSKPDQQNFYLCDNVLEGRLKWPSVYSDDGGAHANDDGIHVEGDGHVVCHNTISGFGDAMKVEQDGARSDDFYGNDVLTAYDNGLELDSSQRNTRCFRNRFTNTYATLSFQPIFGGPAYAIRNVIVNVAHEQLKVHALGGMPPEETSGIFVLHNTFVSPGAALNLADDSTAHHFRIENNLFVGSSPPPNGRVVDWEGTIDDGHFDFDGYFPDGEFKFVDKAKGVEKFASFAAVQAGGIEKNGVLLAGAIFKAGLMPPADYKTMLPAPDASLAEGSNAIDTGAVLANVNDGFRGKAPDLGAIESGCKPPVYGVRPEGKDEANLDDAACNAAGGAGGSGGSGAGGASSSSSSSGAGGASSSSSSSSSTSSGSGAQPSGGGCGCRVAANGDETAIAVAAALAALALARRRRAH